VPAGGGIELAPLHSGRHLATSIRAWTDVTAAVTLIAAGLCLGEACGDRRGESEAAAQVRPAATAESGAPAMVHGNHNPKFGGVVLMNGDMHFEVVLGTDGRYQVYFSDAARAELPASVASDVTITVTRQDKPPETIKLEIDESGESWVGRGRPPSSGAVARIAYTSRTQPYWIDLPFSAMPAASQ
jgi:hypothetical protein